MVERGQGDAGGEILLQQEQVEYLFIKETLIIGNQRSTLVAFTVGEKYQPGGEFKVLIKQRNKDSVRSAVHLTRT